MTKSEIQQLEEEIRWELRRDYGDIYYESHDEEMNILVQEAISEYLLENAAEDIK